MSRIISWGCGVQSTTLGELSAQGILPRVDAIITADTGWERQVTCDVRDWYMRRWQGMGMRVEIVSNGINIRDHWHHFRNCIPLWTENGAILKRQCTGDFKVRPIRKFAREMLGYPPAKAPNPPAGAIEQWIGISLDEHARARPSDVRYIRNRWPLIERQWTRENCVDWLGVQRLPIPPKSACICCPYRRASEWLVMRNEAPDEFEAACQWDETHRHTPRDLRVQCHNNLYLHRSIIPLRDVDLERWAAAERETYGVQIPFMAMCESGACWV